MSMNNNLTVFIDAPFLPADEYARRTGETVRAVTNQCQQGKLPTKKRESNQGKFYINMVLLHKLANEQEY